MTKRESITLLAKDKQLNTVAKSIARNNPLYKDILQDALLCLLEMTEEKYNSILKKPEYCIKLMLNTYNGSRSIYRELRHFDCDFSDADAIPVSYEKITDRVDVTEDDFEKVDYVFSTTTSETVKVSRVLYDLKKEDKTKGKYPFRTEVFKLYLTHGSSRKVQKAVGIPYRSVCNVVNEVRQIINQRSA